MNDFRRWLLFGGMTLFAAGCHRGDGVNRLPIHGTVQTASGEKLTAQITFLPIDPKRGPAANATVTDGKYHFDRTNGPTPGPTKVVVRRIITREAEMKAIIERKAQVPMKTLWRLARDVPDDGNYVQDFTLDN